MLRKRSYFVKPGVHAVFPGTARQGKCDQTVVQRTDSVTVHVPQGDDMGVAEACPEPVEGKTFNGRFGSGMWLPTEMD